MLPIDLHFLGSFFANGSNLVQLMPSKKRVRRIAMRAMFETLDPYLLLCTAQAKVNVHLYVLGVTLSESFEKIQHDDENTTVARPRVFCL